MKRVLLIAVFFSGTIRTTEYLYPVAVCNPQQIYVLYQKSIDHVELWLWNSITKKASKALLSTFSPAGLQLLPDGSSFSFIDNDRIRVKMYGKRQPKAVDLYEPIYDLSLIHWIDNELFYLSAKEKEQYSIFQGSIYGTCHRIIGIDDGDCMYPHLYNKTLYYIERSHNQYAVMSVPYPIIPHEECVPCTDPSHFEAHVKTLIQEKTKEKQRSYANSTQKKLIVDFNDMPIAFLHMISESFGFVIAYPASVNRSDSTIIFTCHALEHTDHEWNSYPLFSFIIPSSLLITGSSERLFESILPLLVHYDGENALFFPNANKFDPRLNIYEYRLDTCDISKKTSCDENGMVFFPPVFSKFGNWYGGSLATADEFLANRVCMYFDQDGDVCFNLPLLNQ